MIDIHAHILPGIDDGAKNWQETLDMCVIAANDGIHTIVATPHVKRGMFTPAKAAICSKVAELNELLTPSPPPLADSSSLIAKNHRPRAMSHELHSSHLVPRSSSLAPLPLTILPGADNAFEPDILDQIGQETALFVAHPFPNPQPLADSSSLIAKRATSHELHSLNLVPRSSLLEPRSSIFRYILLELPDYFLFPQVKDLIRKLREKNIVPVLSHPERIAMIQRNYKLLHEFIQAGALSQITAMSVTGEFGKEIKKLTRTLIKKNLAHVIATDAHSRERRPPILSRAVSEAADLIGSDKAERMVKGTPQAMIEGREIIVT